MISASIIISAVAAIAATAGFAAFLILERNGSLTRRAHCFVLALALLAAALWLLALGLFLAMVLL